MTQVLLRTGTPPAADTSLPLWDEVHPLFIPPNKLTVGDNLKGASVAVTGSAPSWDETALSVTWAGAAYTRTTGGFERTSQSGRNIAWINSNVANVRVICTMENALLSGDYPGIIFRRTDNDNYWTLFFDVPNNILRLKKYVAGSSSNASTGYAVGGAFASGERLEVRCSGNDISVYCEGVFLGTATDSFNASATGVGVHTLDGASAALFTNFMAGSH